MVRDCRKDFGFKISGYGVNLADDALAGMGEFCMDGGYFRLVMPYFYRDGCGGHNGSAVTAKSAV